MNLWKTALMVSAAAWVGCAETGPVRFMPQEDAGPARDGWIAVTTGLRAGDLVISGTSPAPGARVRVTEPWRASLQPSAEQATQPQAKEANPHERH